ncbi:MAG TPA: sulfotransferase [Candidatus Binataceae bacterium]|nr:sulfotransferase [Candidatus Binataceae bacterium]
MADRHPAVNDGSAPLFVVIGAQRTGTNILREILNTNPYIAMLGEVLSPSPAPAHWDNFCRDLQRCTTLPRNNEEAELLLDNYFQFVRYRIRNHWENDKKRDSRAFGVDIKYNQLSSIEPANWNSSSFPFILGYLRSRGATLVHVTRNIIHSAISMLVALQRDVWHNYDGAVIDRAYQIDADDCLSWARTIVRHRDAFLRFSHDCKVVSCPYERLMENMEQTGSQKEIREGPGPLKSITEALGVPFSFQKEGRLQKAINVPYSKLLVNFDTFIKRLRDSEFSTLVSTLD